MLYLYYGFFVIKSYSSPYGNYTIERGYKLSDGTVYYNYYYRVKNEKGSIVVEEGNYEGAKIRQIIWFKDSAYVHFSGSHVNMYTIYNLKAGKEGLSDSICYARNVSKGVLINVK